uniref:Uncharacterized protein n=1 Tax=Oryza rufipogon TaxID=4529 RepID=A0A0E0PCT2_ORYRU
MAGRIGAARWLEPGGKGWLHGSARLGAMTAWGWMKTTMMVASVAEAEVVAEAAPLRLGRAQGLRRHPGMRPVLSTSSSSSPFSMLIHASASRVRHRLLLLPPGRQEHVSLLSGNVHVGCPWSHTRKTKSTHKATTQPAAAGLIFRMRKRSVPASTAAYGCSFPEGGKKTIGLFFWLAFVDCATS